AMLQNRLNELQKKLQEAYTDLLNTSMSQEIGQDASVNLRSDVRLDGQDGTAQAKLLAGIAGENGFEDIGIVPKTASRADNKNETSINYATPGFGANSGTNLWRAPGIAADQLDSPSTKADDGITGYGRLLDTDNIQFRTLLDKSSAAGTVNGEVHITFRVEDDPPPPVSASASLDMLNSVTSGILGGPPDPTYFNQKVAQSSTTYKTGGFWSAVNYLYNFAPREIKYSYAVGYTAHADETGNEEYLIDGQLTDVRDQPGGGQAYLDTGKRVKWASFDPTEGYELEKSGTAGNYNTVFNREKVWTFEDASGDQQWYATQNANTLVSGTRNIVNNLLFQSGTYTYNGTFVNEYGNGSALSGTTNVGGVIIQDRAMASSGLVSLATSNIEEGSIFRNKVELTSTVSGSRNDDETAPSLSQDFSLQARGATRSSLFFNHYEVETRTVEFNTDRRDVREIWNPTANPSGTPTDISDDVIGKVYAYGGIARSHTVDTSKNYDITDSVPDDPANPSSMAADLTGFGGAGGPDGVPDDFKITRTTGNVNNSFNGEFIQGLHKIESVNGQDIVGNETKQASPVIGNFEIGKYEGLLRSEQMSRNVVAFDLPTDTEINAANSVPTDWYQTELLTPPGQDPADPTQGYVWFPYVEDTLYSDTSGDGYGRPTGVRQQVHTRNTFQLNREEFMTLQPVGSWIADPSGVLRPTYVQKDYWIDVDLRGINYDDSTNPPHIPQMYINGREVRLDAAFLATLGAGNGTVTNTIGGAPSTTGSAPKNVHARINIGGDPSASALNLALLQEGYNTIAIEASDAAYNAALGANNYLEGVRITTAGSNTAGASSGAGTTNTAAVDKVINSKIITGYLTPVGQAGSPVKFNTELTRNNTLRVQGRWSSRAVPESVESDFSNKLVTLASTSADTGSSFKVSNSFIEMIINAINQQKYRDIFRMGLMSNLNKVAIQGQANLPNGASMQ
ncbi:MAG: hypothetical protein ACAI44_40425, partial [Candidatus Sericytochromatia bacterium]